MCGAGCGDGEVAVMPPAALVTVAVLGSCCCDYECGVVVTTAVAVVTRHVVGGVVGHVAALVTSSVLL